MQILVTGGAGFIGSAVVRHLVNETDVIVINVDALTYAGNLDSLGNARHHPRHIFEHVDIRDRAALDKVLRTHEPDAIMHLAAESHVDRSIDGPAPFIETNIAGTCNLLEAAREYWNTLPEDARARFRFHHVSTDEVYGDLADDDECLMLNDECKEQSAFTTHNSQLKTGSLFTEQTPYAPSSPYAASKASADHLVRAWHRTYGLPTLITNCSNNYGPFHFPEKLIPLVILNALEGKELPVYGRGEQVRDWLYVEDHARALCEVITRGVVGETYNIGGHNEKQNIEVVRSICDIMDELAPSKLNIKHSKLITHVKDRPGHDQRYAIDASKIERDLGWTPSETFESGIRKTVAWYLDNQRWCERVQDGSYQRQRLGVE